MMLNPCGCCPAPGLCAVYTIRGCPNAPLGYAGWSPGSGVEVRIRASSGGALVASGTTDADGKVTLCVPTSASRWVEVDAIPSAGFGAFGASMVTNSVGRTIEIQPASGRCCAPSTCGSDRTTMPSTYWTDATGTYAMGSPPTVCIGLTRFLKWRVPNAWVFEGGVWVIKPADVAIKLEAASAPGGVRVSRYWTEEVRLLDGEPVTAYYDGVVPSYMSSAVISLGDCSTPYGSAIPVTVVGDLPDPVGGTVVISG